MLKDPEQSRAAWQLPRITTILSAHLILVTGLRLGRQVNGRISKLGVKGSNPGPKMPSLDRGTYATLQSSRGRGDRLLTRIRDVRVDPGASEEDTYHNN